MTHTLRRGSVVLRGRQAAVVWDVAGSASVVVFPIRHGSVRRAGDVPIEALADQLVTRAKSGATIWTVQPRSVRRTDLTYSGELSGPLMCLVSQAVIRAACAAAQEAKWANDRRHRRVINEERTAAR